MACFGLRQPKECIETVAEAEFRNMALEIGVSGALALQPYQHQIQNNAGPRSVASRSGIVKENSTEFSQDTNSYLGQSQHFENVCKLRIRFCPCQTYHQTFVHRIVPGSLEAHIRYHCR